MPNSIHTCTHLNHQSIPIPVGLVGAGGSENGSINQIAKPVDASTSAAARTVVILPVIVDLNVYWGRPDDLKWRKLFSSWP